MTKARVIEPEGVNGDFTVESYDRMMRGLMEKGYLDTSQIIKAGIIIAHFGRQVCRHTCV